MDLPTAGLLSKFLAALTCRGNTPPDRFDETRCSHCREPRLGRSPRCGHRRDQFSRRQVTARHHRRSAFHHPVDERVGGLLGQSKSDRFGSNGLGEQIHPGRAGSGYRRYSTHHVLADLHRSTNTCKHLLCVLDVFVRRGLAPGNRRHAMTDDGGRVGHGANHTRLLTAGRCDGGRLDPGHHRDRQPRLP